MPTKRWPHPPTPAFLDKPYEGFCVGPMFTVEPTVTSCKHGKGSCECGTHDRRDALHSTKGGQGAVARLRRGK